MTTKYIDEFTNIINNLPAFPILINPDNSWKQIDFSNCETKQMFAETLRNFTNHVYDHYSCLLNNNKWIQIITCQKPAKYKQKKLNEYATKLLELSNQHKYLSSYKIYGPCIFIYNDDFNEIFDDFEGDETFCKFGY